MCSDRPNKSSPQAAENVGMVRENRDSDRISKRISDMQSESSFTYEKINLTNEECNQKD